MSNLQGPYGTSATIAIDQKNSTISIDCSDYTFASQTTTFDLAIVQSTVDQSVIKKQQITIEYKVKTIKFDMSEFKAAPLTCSKADRAWIMYLPAMLNESD